ncbi:DUF3164 family protein [Ferrovibrio terrae]|uniref:DUF3164 family protein n=1 Tax=Ferrovibrio terrae TaxID=2594003 RepID=UPI003137FCCC
MTEHSKIEVPAGFMLDSRGAHVPEGNVRPIDKLEDQLVRKIHGFGQDLSDQIARFFGHTIDDIDAFLELLAEKYNAKPRGKKGNMTFTSYDGTLKVQVQVAEHIAFGAELQVAKQLVDACLTRWSGGSDPKYIAVVNNAFNVDKQQNVNRQALFALRKLEIADPEWNEAMRAIADAVRVVGSKMYVRMHRRANAQSRWRLVPIDLAAVERA